MTHAHTQLPSERSFGILFAAVFLLCGASAEYKFLSPVTAILLLSLAMLTLLIALVVPRWLSPFNRAWFALGLLLSRFVNPFVLGAIFFLIITPFALIARAFGRDELKLHKQEVSSYWIDRTPIADCKEAFKTQF